MKGRLDNSTGGSSLNSPLAEQNESSTEGRMISKHDTETNARQGEHHMHIGKTTICTAEQRSSHCTHVSVSQSVRKGGEENKNKKRIMNQKSPEKHAYRL